MRVKAGPLQPAGESSKEPVEATPAPQPVKAKEQIAEHVLGVPPGLWEDSDVCWLTGAHVAGEHTYIVREPYEQLLWWLSLPRLLRLAESAEPHRADAAMVLDDVNRALVGLETAGYKLDELLEPERVTEDAVETAQRPEKEALHTVPKTGPETGPGPEDLEPQEPVSAKPVGPKDPDGPPEEY
jgi:hypothetical protein